MIPANDNASTKNISGMTPKQVVEQEAFVRDILDIADELEAMGIDPWEND